jgi:hypothetical protein
MGKKNLRNKKIFGTILNVGELSEVGDIMNFQILLMEKYKTGNRSLTPNGNDSDVPPGIRDGLERLVAESDVNLGIGTPKVDYRIVYQLKYATATFCVQ